MGFVVPRRNQRAKQDTRLRRGATIRVHFHGQSACFSTAQPRTVELQQTHVPRSFPGAVERVEEVGRHSISYETRCSISRLGPERASRPSSSCVRPQHRSLLTTRAIPGRTPKGSRVDKHSARDAKLASASLLNLETHHIKQSLHAVAHPASVLRGQFFAKSGLASVSSPGTQTHGTSLVPSFGLLPSSG